MVTRTCILLSVFLGLAAAIGVIRPVVDAPNDSIFSTEANKIATALSRLDLVSLVDKVHVKYGDMVRLGATGYWDLQKALTEMEQQARANVPKKIEAEIQHLKDMAVNANPPITVSKRSTRFPMDFGDHKLVFLVSDIIVPEEQ